MKKKVLSLALVVILALVAIGTASLAYLTDTDTANNVFTVGNVKIDLYEDFGDNTGDIQKLLPAVGSAQQGNLENGIEKEVYVENIGTENAYVRVQIAIPAVLDEPTDASKNLLHFNYTPDSIGEDLWDWSKSGTDDKYQGDWNTYKTTIGEGEDAIEYNVYVVTYGAALAKGDTTVAAMTQVYLDSAADNDDLAEAVEALGDEWHIYVVAEACQAAGFENAYDALNAAFGTPGATGYTAPDFEADAEESVFVDLDSEPAEEPATPAFPG